MSWNGLAVEHVVEVDGRAVVDIAERVSALAQELSVMLSVSSG